MVVLEDLAVEPFIYFPCMFILLGRPGLSGQLASKGFDRWQSNIVELVEAIKPFIGVVAFSDRGYPCR
jgi:hypothetical protein